jgi:hypothetical protein
LAKEAILLEKIRRTESTVTATATWRQQRKPLQVPADTAPVLSFQRLDVYQRAIEVFSVVYEVLARATVRGRHGDSVRAASLDVMRLRKLLERVVAM